MSTPSIKVVAVGDSCAGKSCLLSKYTYDTIPVQYTRTVFDKFEAEVKLESQLYNLVLWDTPGDDDYDQMRPLSYPDTDVFLLCYSTVDPASLTNLWQKWLKEVRKFADANPVIIVVGLKSDARHDKTQRAIQARGGVVLTTEQGKSFAEAAGAAAFVECSALKSRRVTDVFVAAAQASWRSKQTQRNSAFATQPITTKKSKRWFTKKVSKVALWLGYDGYACPDKRTNEEHNKKKEARTFDASHVSHA